MPKFSHGSIVKQRVKCLLSAMLAYAGDELDGCNRLLKCRWQQEDSANPKLEVETRLRYLAELTKKAKIDLFIEIDLSAEQVREAIGHLKALKILEKKPNQGSEIWKFTLKLWSKDKDKNLKKFEEEWEQPRTEKHKTQEMIKSKKISILEKEIKISPAEATLPIHNLPTPDYTACIGRDKEISQLLEWLTHPSVYHISVEGIGGVGKTTLVLETAYRCLDASCRGSGAFDAIIFTSAQTQRLMDSDIGRCWRRHSNTSDILRAIASTLTCDITHATFEKLLERIYNSLQRYRTLLIVDNLETIEDRKDTLSLLRDLPPRVKVIITSREQTKERFSLHLQPLSAADNVLLIQHQAQTTPLKLSDEFYQKLYQSTGGIPAAINYIMGQLRGHRSPDVVLNQLNKANDDIPRFWFENSLQLVRGQPSHYLLMTLTLFPKAAAKEALAFVALPEAAPFIIDEAFAQLQQLFLLTNRPPLQEGEQCYDMLPLTRGYVFAELEANPDFQQQAQERWIKWYLRFSAEHGAQDEREWNEYRQLESEWENLRAAILWCIDNDRYEDFLQFWRNVKSYSHAQGYYWSDRLIYWETRLDWTNRLIQAAQQRQEKSTVAEMMFDRAWTLTLMGGKHQELAKNLFAQAWKLRKHKDLTFQIDLAIHIAVLRLYQHKFPQARRWLKLSQQMLDAHPTVTRHQVHLFYYQGQICYHTGDYHQAKSHYQQALFLAKDSGWRRAVYLAENRIANVAIKLGNLNEAKGLLEKGLRVAQEHNDSRRTAFCKRSMVMLEQAQGNLSEARSWAVEAIAEFNSLGLNSQAEEISSWFQDL